MYTTDASGHLTLSLKHGQEVTLQDLPQGTKYTITESGADYYTTTFSVTGGTLGSSGSHTQSGALTGSADVIVQVKNDLNIAVPTGIRTEVQPFLVLLAFSLVTLLLMIFAKKRNARR
jgi:fibronectin-binding protein 1